MTKIEIAMIERHIKRAIIRLCTSRKVIKRTIVLLCCIYCVVINKKKVTNDWSVDVELKLINLICNFMNSIIPW